MDSALNNLEWQMCQETKTKPNETDISHELKCEKFSGITSKS